MVEIAGSIGAPFLSGISFALVAIVVQASALIRWPDWDEFLFLAAGLLFIEAAHSSFWFKRYQHEKWKALCRRTYNSAVLFLFAALALLVIPPGGALLHLPVIRKASVGVVALAFIAELLWINAARMRAKAGTD
jgi:hypothetical protein